MSRTITLRNRNLFAQYRETISLRIVINRIHRAGVMNIDARIAVGDFGYIIIERITQLSDKSAYAVKAIRLHEDISLGITLVECDRIDYAARHHTNATRIALGSHTALQPVFGSIVIDTTRIVILIVQTGSRNTDILDDCAVTDPSKETSVTVTHRHTGVLLVQTVDYMSLTVKGTLEPVFAFVFYTIVRSDGFPRQTKRAASPILPIGSVTQYDIVIQHNGLAGETDRR